MASTPRCQTMESALAGVRRVDCVRVVEAERLRFFLVGVGHRFPVEREVSPKVALELMRTVPARPVRSRPRRVVVV